MKNIFFLMAIIITGMLLSCTKHKGDIPEHIPVASIDFLNPAGQTWLNSDSVSIQAVAKSTETIHGYDFAIKKLNDTTTYFFSHVHDHNTTLNINQKWKSSFTGMNNMEAIITLYLDHDGHTLVKKLPFMLQ